MTVDSKATPWWVSSRPPSELRTRDDFREEINRLRAKTSRLEAEIGSPDQERLARSAAEIQTAKDRALAAEARADRLQAVLAAFLDGKTQDLLGHIEQERDRLRRLLDMAEAGWREARLEVSRLRNELEALGKEAAE